MTLCFHGLDRTEYDKGIPDFEMPHIRRLPGYDSSGRVCLACCCGSIKAVAGLAWFSWMEQHRECGEAAEFRAGAGQRNLEANLQTS